HSQVPGEFLSLERNENYYRAYNTDNELQSSSIKSISETTSHFNSESHSSSPYSSKTTRSGSVEFYFSSIILLSLLILRKNKSKP
ncbi:MAG: hypothetical protein ACXAC7_22630, partial [Candidatus Hodarchaeales archaeon]